ncbi:uncharacterized protein LOC130909040 [Corythoichthys intestinalis]|uniref:uncharacterized protein LOC130909040 n=1 Tax=Corythoichthys intestinalis TaxID=161448 RepID=UPI0025A612AD|nr:uncharacterized protein LOC130909040 [Corythoichthys intestinalis]XP_061809890.1 uncharacterized protein LOC133600856 [Nerophis lumbriciformis]
METVEDTAAILASLKGIVSISEQSQCLTTRLVAHIKRQQSQRQAMFLRFMETERVADDRRRQRRLRILQRLIAQRSSPSVWVRTKADDWWRQVLPSFTDQQFVENFRTSKETFQYLCRRLRPAMERVDTTFRLAVPLDIRIAVALWKLATNSDYRSIGHIFGIGLSTACDCLREFCSAVEEVLLPEVLKMPSLDKMKEHAQYFEQRWGLPQCIGAVDGSHIPILAPQQYHTEYFNRKGWYSIVLQAVVDGRGLIWNAYTGQPGSLHDARVLRLSALWELAERGRVFSQEYMSVGGQNVGYYIIGDAAYPLKSWLMKPFADTGALTKEEQTFNVKTSRARVVVEHAFGRLKGRWRCLQKRNDCSLERIKSMVLTCCVLHNLCESHNEMWREEWSEPLPPDSLVQPPATDAEGVAVRSALMRHFVLPN